MTKGTILFEGDAKDGVVRVDKVRLFKHFQGDLITTPKLKVSVTYFLKDKNGKLKKGKDGNPKTKTINDLIAKLKIVVMDSDSKS